MARCMCVSCLCGREPVLSRSAGAAAAALVVLGAQMCPAAAQQCPLLSCQGRGWAFWGAARGLHWGWASVPSRQSGEVRLWCFGLELGIWARIRKWEWPGVPDVSPFQLWAWLLSCCVARPKQQPVGVNCLEILWFQRGSISRQDEAGGSWPPGDGRRRCGSVQLQVVDNTNQPNKPYHQQITNQKKTKSKQAVMQRHNLLRLVKKARSQYS